MEQVVEWLSLPSTQIDLERFLIRADRSHVVLGLKDTGKTGEIVKPELGGAIDIIVRQTRKLVSS